MTRTFGPEGKLMFAFLIYGLNLSSVPKLFDVKAGVEYYSNGVFVNSTSIALETCTIDHFDFSSELKK